MPSDSSHPVLAIRMQVCASPKSMMLFNLRTAKCCSVALILLVILTFCNAYIFDFFRPTCTDTILKYDQKCSIFIIFIVRSLHAHSFAAALWCTWVDER